MLRIISLLLITLAGMNPAVAISNKDVVIAINGMPPYVSADKNGGILLALTREAFLLQGVENIRFELLANKRALRQLKHCAVDGALNIEVDKPQEYGLYYSEGLLEIENVAVALAENGLKIASPRDLAGLRVLAFQGARSFLGRDYADALAHSASYEEVVNQEAQVGHLMKGWVDVIILEKRIFNYYLMQYEQSGEAALTLVYPIFNPRPRRILFCDQLLRSTFNQGLEKLRESGRYDAIVNSFMEPENR